MEKSAIKSIYTTHDLSRLLHVNPRSVINWIEQDLLQSFRTPGGHPEGYLEAFANIYRNVALTIQARLMNQKPDETWLDFPSVDDGVRGMKLIDAIIDSGKGNSKWIKL